MVECLHSSIGVANIRRITNLPVSVVGRGWDAIIFFLIPPESNISTSEIQE